jgi:endonuclease YncB( thermonuclease family)
MFIFRSFIVAFLTVCAIPVLADTEGPLRVIDGDTFDVGGVRVRLHGVDAPERNQTCEDAQGAIWECGAWVTAQVEARFGGRYAVCEERDVDRYGRMVARCTVDGRDVGEEIVLDGLATAYRRYAMDYDLAEKSAQVAGVGIWAGTVESPADFRASRSPVGARAPAGEPATAPAGEGQCLIKGNISGNGRIYHMPHNRDYAATRIDPARGERWFCSEGEAQAAGWRAARN